jgi:hypothetical protein
VRTWFGASAEVAIRGADSLAVTLPTSLAAGLEARVVLPKSLDAPVSSGQRVGEVIYSSGGTRDYATAYRAFRGRDPHIEALLEGRGLITTAAA